MSGAWENRVLIDPKGQMYFAAVRFRVGPNGFEKEPSGFAPPFLEGKTISEMRKRAQNLAEACDRTLIEVDALPDLGQAVQREIIAAAGMRDA